MKTIKLSELKDYEGIDASLEISLYEYGLLTKKENKNIHVWCGVGADKSGNYIEFVSYNTTEEELNNIINESWFDKKAFFQTADIKDDKEYKKLWYVHKLSDLLCYYGHENVLGSCYFPIEIINDL